MTSLFTVVGLGELLWDLFEDAQRLGGAPANVAYHATVLGNHGLVASCVGRDALGAGATEFLRRRGVDVSLVQEHRARPTGSTHVRVVDQKATFEIIPDTAWMDPQWTSPWEEVMAQADAICFGTLLCSGAEGRSVVKRAVDCAPSRALRCVDLNLRPPFDTAEAIETAICMANVVKLNESESRVIEKQYGVEDPARWLISERGMRFVAVTRGARGSLLLSAKQHHDCSGVELDGTSGDPVGAGDAFGAALTHHLLRGSPLERANIAANRYAAFVASCPGAMPPVPPAVRSEVAG